MTIECCTMDVRIQDYCVGISSNVVVVVLIFLKHNDLCGQAVSSSQLCSQSTQCTHFCAHVTLFACMFLYTVDESFLWKSTFIQQLLNLSHNFLWNYLANIHLLQIILTFSGIWKIFWSDFLQNLNLLSSAPTPDLAQYHVE